MSAVPHQGLPLGAEAGQHHGGAAPQICGLQCGCVKPAHPADPCFPVLQPDPGTQLKKLRHLAVAVFKDGLPKEALPFRPQQRRHQQRLRVGGKAGIGRGDDWPYSPEFARRAQVQAITFSHYITACLI